MKNNYKKLILLLIAMLLMGSFITACGGGDDGDEDRASSTDDDEEPPPEDEEDDPEEDTEEDPEEDTEEDVVELPDTVPFENEALGVALSYPEEWVIEFDELSGEVNLASSQEVLDTADDRVTGAILNVLTLAADDLQFLGENVDPTDPVSVLTVFQEFILAGDSEDTIEMTMESEAEAIQVNGQSGAIMVANAVDSETGEEATVELYVVLGANRAAVIISGAEESVEDEFRPVLNAIVQSLTLSEVAVTEDPLPPPPPTGDITSAGFLLFGDVVSGAAPDGDRQAWDFVGLAGETVDVIVEPVDDFDAVVDVVDAAGVSILEFGEVDNSFDVEEIRGLVIPADGTYYIIVRGFADVGGAYALTLAEAGSTTGPAVPPPTGSVIAFGETVSGAIEEAGGVATYSFSGAADDIIGMVLIPDFDATIDVLDAAGNTLFANVRDASFGSENALAYLPEDGNYTIVVAGFEGETGSFDLTVGQPFNNVVFAVGDALTEDDLDLGHAFPFFAFNAGEMVGIYAEPFGELDLAIRVFGPDGEFVEGLGFTEERGFDSSFGAEELAFIAPESGEYLVRVLNSQDEGVDTGDYEVTLMSSTEVVFEIVLGDLIDAQTNSEGLVEYRFFAGSNGGPITFEVVPDDEAIDAVIEILDFDGNVLASVDDTVNGELETLTYDFAPDQLLLVRVSDFFGNSGGFVLSSSDG